MGHKTFFSGARRFPNISYRRFARSLWPKKRKQKIRRRYRKQRNPIRYASGYGFYNHF